MTHTFEGHCGKCHQPKDNEHFENELRQPTIVKEKPLSCEHHKGEGQWCETCWNYEVKIADLERRLAIAHRTVRKHVETILKLVKERNETNTHNT